MTDYRRIDREKLEKYIESDISMLGTGVLVAISNCLEPENNWDTIKRVTKEMEKSTIPDITKPESKSKEETKGMDEMEYWSCDKHLNICDKHTDVEHEAKECEHPMLGECKHNKLKECNCCFSCNKMVNIKATPTPPSKQPPPRVWQTRVSQTTRLEDIREKLNDGDYYGFTPVESYRKDIKYLLSIIDRYDNIKEDA